MCIPEGLSFPTPVLLCPIPRVSIEPSNELPSPELSCQSLFVVSIERIESHSVLTTLGSQTINA